MQDQFIHKTVRSALSNAEKLMAQLEAEYGDIPIEEFLDTIDGETDIEDLLIQVADHIKEREAYSKAVAERIADLQARKSRVDDSVKTLRTLIAHSMEKLGQDKISGVSCTLSLKDTLPHAEIINEEEIPTDFFKTVIKLDTTSVSKALREGVVVPGARLGLPGKSLTIRVK